MINHPSARLLDAKLEKKFILGSVAGLLGWDEQVNLPSGSGELRAKQMAAMSEISHAAASDPEIDPLLQELEIDFNKLSFEERTIVKHARKDYDHATKLPAAWVAEKAMTDSQAYHAWVEARKTNDFESYAPWLEKQIDLLKQSAAYLGKEDNPYDFLIDQFDPGMDAATIDQLFGRLREQLVPLVKEILDSPNKPRVDFLRGFPIEKQRQFIDIVTQKIGFDFEYGRIDIAVHPFCGGTGDDTRMTTRYREDLPFDSLYSVIHETGHGLYEQGLDRDHLHNALGEHIGMGIHESQSRMWENQVGRSRAFWTYFDSFYRDIFPEQLEGVSQEELYRAANEVTVNPIRVDSDEVTYNLHIMLRFDLEKRLFSGELDVADLPAAWNKLCEELLGYTPKDNTEGVLQDVHWSGGAFGYFPSYCLGNMIAAQLWYTALKEMPDLMDHFAKGDFSKLLVWLREKVHSQGKRYDTQELVKRITGEPINPDYLVRYLKERYLPLYG